MMRSFFLWFASFTLLSFLYLFSFTLPEHSQALILQFGKIQGEPITQAGLHFRIPFVQEIRFFEKRILQWDGARDEIPTRDRKFIWVDATARWRIKDALMFYRALKDVPTALSRMGTILNGVTKDTISSYNLIETVRNSNEILDDVKHNTGIEEIQEGELTIEELIAQIEEIKVGREKISELIKEQAQKQLENFGIELIDVQLRSIAYKEVVEQKVYKRMISERHKIATQIRSFGAGEKAKVLGQLELSLKRIQSEAYRKSQEIRGKAEAEAARIYAQALKEDPEYYEFVKTLETYKRTLSGKGQFILSTDNAFLKLLNKG